MNNKIDNELVREKEYKNFKESNNERVRKIELQLTELQSDFNSFQAHIGVDLKGK